MLLRLIAVFLTSTLIASCGMLSPRIDPGGVIFQDDFAREDSGWDRYSDTLYSADYQNGFYLIRVESPNMTAWGRPNIDLENVLIRVEGMLLDGPLNNVYGVLCRYEDSENFYFFMISSDGYAGIGRYVEGNKQLLSHETLLPSEAINPSGEANLIQAACVGEDLTLWVNGEPVAEAMTTDLSRGDVGLLVGTYDEGGVKIAFDNFSTLMP